MDSPVDCKGTCKYVADGSLNPSYIGLAWGIYNICSAGCGTDYCDGTLGCDECGLCNGFGNNGTMWGKGTYYQDRDKDGKGDMYGGMLQLCPADASAYVLDDTDYLCEADINNDGAMDILDIISMVQEILNN